VGRAAQGQTDAESKHYRGVLKQQGRVQVDSDWNELEGESWEEDEEVCLVYLDVWQRILQYPRDPSISNPTSGGPDTSRRAKPLWQVRVVRIRKGRRKSSIESAARTMARRIAVPTLTVTLPPSGGYSGLENRFYRVEVHGSGAAPSGLSFDWSRDEVSTYPSPKVHEGIPLAQDEAIALEGGVSIKFPKASYRAGDCWLLPARTPKKKRTGTSRRIIHHYRPLAILSFGSGGGIY
jgi:hypothetical protein